MNSKDSKSLYEIWDLRRSGQVELAKEQFNELLRKHNCRQFKNFNDMLTQLSTSSWSQSEIADIITFEASLFLRIGKFDEAHSLLNEIEQYLNSYRLPLTYQVLFQKALTLSVKNLKAEAAACFAKAAKNADSTQQKLQALLNVFICQEPIGLIDERDLETFLTEAENVASEAWASDFIGQCDALKYRQLFLHGKLRFDPSLSISHARGFQSRYFLAHLAGIPWLKYRDSSQYIKTIATELCTSENAYEGMYRMRTLLAVLDHSDFSNVVRLSTHIERLYLWVWNWLADPNPNKLRNALAVAKYVTSTKIGTLGGTEQVMLENALSWLCLFRGESATIIYEFLGSAHHTKNAAIPPQLHAEKQIINRLFLARESENAIDKNLLTNILDSTLLQSTNTNSVEEFLDGLPEAFISGISSLPKIKSAGKISIDLLDRSAHLSTEQAITQLSEQYCRLMYCFKDRDLVPLAEVLHIVLGIRRYIPNIHDPKLAKLLYSANENFENLARFRRKGSAIIVEMNRSDIQFVRCSEHILAALLTIDEFELGSANYEDTTSLSKTAEKPAIVDLEKPCSRKDLEDMLGLSKATLNRRLKLWIKSKKVRAIGSGPKTQYQILDTSIIKP